MNESSHIPWDIKILSLFLIMIACVYFMVDTGLIALCGVLVSGGIAKVAWAIQSLLYLSCAYGIWRRELVAWKILFILTVFSLGSQALNMLFLSTEAILSIVGEKGPVDPAESRAFFWFFLLFDFLFIVYLLKRRPLFLNRHHDG